MEMLGGMRMTDYTEHYNGLLQWLLTQTQMTSEHIVDCAITGWSPIYEGLATAQAVDICFHRNEQHILEIIEDDYNGVEFLDVFDGEPPIYTAGVFRSCLVGAAIEGLGHWLQDASKSKVVV